MIKVWFQKVQDKTGHRYVKGELPSIDFFLDSTLGIGSSVWPTVRRDLKTTFDTPVNEVVKLDGIGSGKSTYVVLCLAYILRLLGMCSDPAKIYGLMPGSKIGIVISSLREKQAKGIIFDELKNRLDSSHWFRTNYRYTDKGASEIEFPNRVFVLSGSSSESVPIGYNILVGCLDEGDWFLKQSHVGDALDQAENVYSSLKERIETRFNELGLTLLVTSARQADGFMLSRYEAARVAQYGLTTRRPYWECKPGRWAPYFRVNVKDTRIMEENIAKYRPVSEEEVLIPMKLKKQYQRNPRLFLRNRASVILISTKAYVIRPDLIRINTDRVNPEIVEGVLPEYIQPIPGALYYAHNDLGFSSDKATAAVAHQEEERTVIDFVFVVDPQEDGKVDFAWFRQMYYELHDRGFQFGLVTFDRFSSLETMNKLEEYGISVETFSMDTDSTPYDAWLEAHYEDLIDVPYIPGYMKEAKALITRGNKVDHVRNKSKDITDAVAGATYHCREQGGVVGAAVV